MMRAQAAAAMLAILHACVVAAPALADTAEGDAEIQPILAGDTAPVSGLLVEQGRYVRFLNTEASVKELGERLAIQVKYCEASEGFYKAEIERVTRPIVWYEDAAFNRWVGFGLGIVATSLAVWGATKVTATE